MGEKLKRGVLIAFTLLLAGCTANTVSSEALGSSSQLETTSQGEESANTETQFKPLSNYRKLSEGGPEHILRLIDNDAYRPLAEYPQLAPYCAYEKAEAESFGVPMEIEIAEADLNEDGQLDYIVKISSLLNGNSGNAHKVLISEKNGVFNELGITMSFSSIAIMDSQTNGFYDISSGGTFYHMLFKYSDEGRYEIAEPLPLCVTKLIGSYGDRSIRDGKLYCTFTRIDIDGNLPLEDDLPFYIGMTIDAYSNFLKEPVLWACDENDQVLPFNSPMYGNWGEYVFVAEILDEEKLREIIEDSSDFWVDDMFIAVPENATQLPGNTP